jgi:hypothetical protein
MDSHPTAKSHAPSWVLVVVAAPMLYVLTFPFVVWTLDRIDDASGMIYPPPDNPAWLEVYGTLFQWLTGTPMVGESLAKYYEWVILKFPRPFS